MNRDWHKLLLCAALFPFGCADGCGCGTSPEAPMVPESVGTTDEFQPSTGSPGEAAPAVEVVQPTAVVEEAIEPEAPLVEAEPTVDPNIPHRVDPNAQIRSAQPPSLQVRPIVPGVDTRLPNHLSPRVVTPQIRYEGPGAELPVPRDPNE